MISLKSLLVGFLVVSCTATSAPPDIEATVQTAVRETVSRQRIETPTNEIQLTFKDKLTLFCWVAYSPTHFNPNTGVSPSEEEIYKDLQTLYDARFRGLVTYGSSGVFSKIPKIAREVGFKGVIMGIWMPTDAQEISNAKNAVSFVDGYSVGNEGLFFHRYEFHALAAAMDDLKTSTNKPVATSEVSSLYYDDANLRNLGDWAFPNVHPYWNGIKEPAAAAKWTEKQFENLSQLYSSTSKIVVFKEVGLPTQGDSAVSEKKQAEYYKNLAAANFPFFYFEAFDQPWKNNQPVEPYWGIFRSDRSAKPVVREACLRQTAYLPMIVR